MNEPPNSRDAHLAAYVTDEGWWAIRSYHELGGKVYVDATQDGYIDLSLISVKGASAAVAITREHALALADELRRVAAP